MERDRRLAVPQGRTSFEQIALLLQGGGALGAYQAGVYEALAEADLHPDWVAGISIGAINSAIIAGNPPERRVDALREFWHAVSTSPLGVPHFGDIKYNDSQHELVNQARAMGVLLFGAPHFFVPRLPPPLIWPPGSPDKASYYDNSLLRATLERLVDFDRLNAGGMRFSVGAVNISTGNFVYFDNSTHTIGPEHVMASGALPPGFPAVEIDGEFYWDGGLVSNTPLQYVLATPPPRDALIFQIDLWSALGALPKDLLQVAVRQKDIQYSSRTRLITAYMNERNHFRHLLHQLMALVPESGRSSASYRRAEQLAATARRNVIHLIYRDKPYESYHKDYQFGMLTMKEHWAGGLSDIRATLEHHDWLEKPGEEQPFVTHDVHRERK
jgi:NTE family protein